MDLEVLEKLFGKLSEDVEIKQKKDKASGEILVQVNRRYLKSNRAPVANQPKAGR